MKRLLPLLLLWSLMSNGYAASTDEMIASIRQHYNVIHHQLPKLKATEFDSGLPSTEGVEAKAFKDAKGTLKLIRTTAYGEMGKSINEYYFHNQQLIFVLATAHQYNAPMYLDDQRAKALGIAPFNPKKSIITENRYYFNNSTLIRWLDNNKKSIASTHVDFAQQEKDILRNSKELVVKAK